MARASSVSQRRYANRREAGRLLASRLASLRTRSPIVLALPRGGVPVGAEIARALGAPLDVIVVRKLGVPFQPELGMGAVGEGGVRVVDEEIVAATHVTPGEFATVEERERVEVERRSRRYHGGRPMVSLEGQTVVVVDDGIATGGTARAALKVAGAWRAREVVLAVPVAPPDTLRALASDADDIVVLGTPQPFFGVGQWYEDFRQTSDDEVIALLQGARVTEGTVAEDDSRAPDPTVDLDLDVEIGALHLPAVLNVPEHAKGLVVFADGSGSSRHSPRNVRVAHRLQRRGLATLLFDLLTPDEEVDRANVLDVELLAVRLLFATRWTRPAGWDRRAPSRLLRGEHWSCRRALGRCRRPVRRGSRLAWGSTRPCHRTPRRGQTRHALHRRRSRYDGRSPQRRGGRHAHLRAPARHRARRDALVRRARDAGGRGRPRGGLVRSAPPGRSRGLLSGTVSSWTGASLSRSRLRLRLPSPTGSTTRQMPLQHWLEPTRRDPDRRSCSPRRETSSVPCSLAAPLPTRLPGSSPCPRATWSK